MSTKKTKERRALEAFLAASKDGGMSGDAMKQALSDFCAPAIREECAQICDALHHTWRWDNEPDSDSGPRSCAAAIRRLATPTAPTEPT